MYYEAGQLGRILLAFACLLSSSRRAESQSFGDDWFSSTVSPAPSTSFISSHTPSNRPSYVPSSNPSLSPSSTPSNEPSIIQSFEPSESPSPKPMTSSQPSSFPPNLNNFPCRVSNSGFYGNREAENLRFIQYKYQIEHSSSSSIKQFVKNVERRISNSIINFTTLFPECAPNERIRRLRSVPLDSLGRILEEEIVVGLSSNPADQITAEECPFDKSSESNNCTVVNGILSLYYNFAPSQSLNTQIHDVIEGVIIDEELSMDNVGIKSTKYIPLSNDQNGASASSRANSKSIVTISFGSIGGLIVVLGLLFFAKKKLKKRKERLMVPEEQTSGSSAVQTKGRHSATSASASDVYSNYYNNNSSLYTDYDESTFVDSTRTISDLTWKTTTDWGR